jgi:hypothetical protein
LYVTRAHATADFNMVAAISLFVVGASSAAHSESDCSANWH